MSWFTSTVEHVKRCWNIHQYYREKLEQEEKEKQSLQEQIDELKEQLKTVTESCEELDKKVLDQEDQIWGLQNENKAEKESKDGIINYLTKNIQTSFSVEGEEIIRLSSIIKCLYPLVPAKQACLDLGTYIKQIYLQQRKDKTFYTLPKVNIYLKDGSICSIIKYTRKDLPILIPACIQWLSKAERSFTEFEGWEKWLKSIMDKYFPSDINSIITKQIDVHVLPYTLHPVTAYPFY